MAKKLKQRDSRRKALKYRGTECLNCSHPLDKSDRYCPYCSQENSNKQLSAWDYFMEFVGSIIVYDSRLQHTIRDLLFKPGKITLDYVQGQRMKYANPFRFFLSVSIIYFLLSGLLPPLISVKLSDNDGASFIEKRMTIPLDSVPISDYKGDVVKAKALGTIVYFSEEALDSMESPDKYLDQIEMYLKYHQYHLSESPTEALTKLEHNITRKNKWIYSRSVSILKIRDNPDDFKNRYLKNIPFFLFFFTPFFALFFWLIYFRKKYNLIEHMIFIFHVFSFLFLVNLILLIPERVFDIDLFTAILYLIVAPLYFYRALRKFYQQNRWKTIIKFIFLSTVLTISLFFGFIIYILGTVASY